MWPSRTAVGGRAPEHARKARRATRRFIVRGISPSSVLMPIRIFEIGLAKDEMEMEGEDHGAADAAELLLSRLLAGDQGIESVLTWLADTKVGTRRRRYAMPPSPSATPRSL